MTEREKRECIKYCISVPTLFWLLVRIQWHVFSMLCSLLQMGTRCGKQRDKKTPVDERNWALEDDDLTSGTCVLSNVRFFATPLTVTLQASPSIGFSRQEYWSRLSFPSPGTLCQMLANRLPSLRSISPLPKAWGSFPKLMCWKSRFLKL